jgi:hypothetical protein
VGRPAGGAAAAGVTLDAEQAARLDAARRFRLTRQLLQGEQIERLAHELPLAQLQVPFVFTESIGPEELDALSQALAVGIEGLHDPAPVSS